MKKLKIPMICVSRLRFKEIKNLDTLEKIWTHCMCILCLELRFEENENLDTLEKI